MSLVIALCHHVPKAIGKGNIKIRPFHVHVLSSEIAIHNISLHDQPSIKLDHSQHQAYKRPPLNTHWLASCSPYTIASAQSWPAGPGLLHVDAPPADIRSWPVFRLNITCLGYLSCQDKGILM